MLEFTFANRQSAKSKPFVQTSIKRLLKGCARALGAEIVSRETAQYWERQSLAGVLAQFARCDVPVNTVIDVGAAHGEWSVMCCKTLSRARYILLEPLHEYETQLKNSLRRIPNAEHHALALDREAGERTIRVHPDLVGSSFYLEAEDSDVNGQPRTIRVDTLDSVRESRNLEPPFLLKLDVQGAEMDVLSGGSSTLADCAFVIIESSFFDFYDNEATVSEILRIMSDKGFVPYDIFGLSYRPLDNALAQADLCFVKVDGPFRRQHFFATAQQRQELNDRLQRMNASIGK